MSVGDDICALIDESECESFKQDLIALCAQYDAVLFARKDSDRCYISVQIGQLWIDFSRVDGKVASLDGGLDTSHYWIAED